MISNFGPLANQQDDHGPKPDEIEPWTFEDVNEEVRQAAHEGEVPDRDQRLQSELASIASFKAKDQRSGD